MRSVDAHEPAATNVRVPQESPHPRLTASPDTTAGPASHSYFSQRLRLHYVDWGNPDAPPLMLLHGGRDHCRNWDWVAAELRHDWHIIAPDLRGHGDSEWSSDGNYGMAGFVYDLAQLIHQQQLAPVPIIAHSLGGNIALRYAGVYPETVQQAGGDRGAGPGAEHRRRARRIAVAERMRDWIDERRGSPAACRAATPRSRRRSSRMQEANRASRPSRRGT